MATNPKTLFPDERILKTMTLTNGKEVVFTANQNNRVNIYLQTNNQRTPIPFEDLYGIPFDCFTDPEKMLGFLSWAYGYEKPYINDSGSALYFGNQIDGGGNIGLNIGHWPVMGSGNKARIVIPYTITASQHTADLFNNGAGNHRLNLNKLFRQSQVDREDVDTINSQFTVIESILEGIKKWNATGIVELISKENYQAKYGNRPDRWIKFSTNVPGICQAPCIGMCTDKQEQTLTCDLAGEFRDNSVQSVLHEIGHVLGLRHEFVRRDRNMFLRTNFSETDFNAMEDCGKFDFSSVMNYALGNYKNGKYIDFSETYRRNHTEACLQRTRNIVGKNPEISAGDIASVEKIYEQALAAARYRHVDSFSANGARGIYLSQMGRSTAAARAPLSTQPFSSWDSRSLGYDADSGSSTSHSKSRKR